MRAILIVAVVSVASSVIADDKIKRPTADAIKRAVEQSRAEYKREYPTPNKFQVIAILDKRLDGLYLNRLQAKDDEEKLKQVEAEIVRVRDAIAKAKKGELPPFAKPLMPLRFNVLQIGSVGAINRAGGKTPVKLDCVQVLGPKRALVSREGTNGDDTTFILQGIDTNRTVEGKAIAVEEIEGVVTGRESYEAVSGASRTVPVIEVFDPDAPFQ